MSVGEGIGGIIRSYNGMVQHGGAARRAAAVAERPRGRGSAGTAGPVCYILYEIYNKKTIYIFIIIYLPCLQLYIIYIIPHSPLSPSILTPSQLYSPAFVAVRFMVLTYFYFLIRKKNKKRPLRFYPQEPLEELHVSIQPGLLAIDIIPHFHSYFKFYLQEKYPQPKPEVFSRKRMYC